VVETDPVLELQLAIDHFEAGVGDGVRVCIAVIDVGGGQVTDHGAGRILGHRVVVERDV